MQWQILQSAVIFQDMLLPQKQISSSNDSDFIFYITVFFYYYLFILSLNSHYEEYKQSQELPQEFVTPDHQYTCTSVCTSEFNCTSASSTGIDYYALNAFVCFLYKLLKISEVLQHY